MYIYIYIYQIYGYIFICIYIYTYIYIYIYNYIWLSQGSGIRVTSSPDIPGRGMHLLLSVCSGSQNSGEHISRKLSFSCLRSLDTFKIVFVVAKMI